MAHTLYGFGASIQLRQPTLDLYATRFTEVSTWYSCRTYHPLTYVYGTG